MNFEELPIYDAQCTEVRKIVRDELDVLAKEAEVRTLMSAVGSGFSAVAIMLAIGATVVFSMDCWHFFQPIANYQQVSTMPWALAGAVSCAIGLAILIASEYK